MKFSVGPSTLYFSLVFFPHALLQMSGFGFEIPRKRHPDGNRIWPQYRIEALVFFGRCMSLLFLAWYRKGNNRAVEKSQHETSKSDLIGVDAEKE